MMKIDPFREENINPQPQPMPATGADAYNGRFVKSFGKEYKSDASRGGGGRAAVGESTNHPSSVK